jgi:hypothetical protein
MHCLLVSLDQHEMGSDGNQRHAGNWGSCVLLGAAAGYRLEGDQQWRESWGSQGHARRERGMYNRGTVQSTGHALIKAGNRTVQIAAAGMAGVYRGPCPQLPSVGWRLKRVCAESLVYICPTVQLSCNHVSCRSWGAPTWQFLGAAVLAHSRPTATRTSSGRFWCRVQQ